MARITIKDLEYQVNYLNKLTGNDPTPWETSSVDGKMKANIGNYHLSGAYGGQALHQMSTENGGIHDISKRGYMTKSALHEWIAAYIAGIESQELLHNEQSTTA